MPSILFVCRANKFRSPLSASILRRIVAHLGSSTGWDISSAGTWTVDGESAPKITFDAAQTLGLTDISDHRTRQINKTILDASDLIIVMEQNQKEAICCEFPSIDGRIYLLPEVTIGSKYDVPDPDCKGVLPDEVSAEILRLLTTGYKKILTRAIENSSPEKIH